MNLREFLKVMGRFGFEKQRQKKHLRLVNFKEKIQLTIPAHGGRDINSKLLELILKQAGISIEEFNQMRKG